MITLTRRNGVSVIIGSGECDHEAKPCLQPNSAKILPQVYSHDVEDEQWQENKINVPASFSNEAIITINTGITFQAL